MNRQEGRRTDMTLPSKENSIGDDGVLREYEAKNSIEITQTQKEGYKIASVKVYGISDGDYNELLVQEVIRTAMYAEQELQQAKGDGLLP